MSCVSCWNSPSASTSPPNAITKVAPPQRWMYGVAARNHLTKASVFAETRGMVGADSTGLSGTEVAPECVDGREGRQRRGLGAQYAMPQRDGLAVTQLREIRLALGEAALGPHEDLDRFHWPLACGHWRRARGE